MSKEIYQQRVTAPDGTKLLAQPIWDGVMNVCGGCYFEQKSCVDLRLNNPTFECSAFDRDDNKSIIWIKAEKEQPISKHDAIKEIRAKTLTLQDEIYKLVEAFEADTGMVVHGMDLSHAQLIGESTVTYHVELDVRLN